MTFHTVSKNRNKIKRYIGRHILNDLNFNIKKKLKNDPSYHLLKMVLIKSANDSLREIFIQLVYTHTHTPATNTQRFAIRFWKGKKNPKV